MTARQIIAAILIIFGAMTASRALLYVNVVGDESHVGAVVLVFGVALIGAGVAVLRLWKE